MTHCRQQVHAPTVRMTGEPVTHRGATGCESVQMQFRVLAAAVLAVSLLASPATAETALPRLQPAEPVFERQSRYSGSPICDGIAGYGATIEQTVQLAFVDPLVSIAEDLARLFRPFFTATEPTGERSARSYMSRNLKPQSPSTMVRMATRKRICG